MTEQQFLTATFANEDKFTSATHRYINANYPQLRHFYFHIANESSTNDITRLKLHSMGVLAGVPDFEFKKPFTWYLELKMPNGVLSFKQKALFKLWADNGEKIEIAYNAQQVVDILKKYLP